MKQSQSTTLPPLKSAPPIQHVASKDHTDQNNLKASQSGTVKIQAGRMNWATMSHEEKLLYEGMKSEKQQKHIQAEIISVYQNKDLQDIIKKNDEIIKQKLKEKFEMKKKERQMRFKQLDDKRKEAIFRAHEVENQSLLEQSKKFEEVIIRAKEDFKKVINTSEKEEKLARGEKPPYVVAMDRLRELEEERQELVRRENMDFDEKIRKINEKEMKVRMNLLDKGKERSSKIQKVLSHIEENRQSAEEDHQRRLVIIATAYVEKIHQIEKIREKRTTELSAIVKEKQKNFKVLVDKMKKRKIEDMEKKKEENLEQENKYKAKIEALNRMQEQKLERSKQKNKEINDRIEGVKTCHFEITQKAREKGDELLEKINKFAKAHEEKKQQENELIDLRMKQLHEEHNKKDKIKSAIATLHDDEKNEGKAINMLKELGFNDSNLSSEMKRIHLENIKKYQKKYPNKEDPKKPKPEQEGANVEAQSLNYLIVLYNLQKSKRSKCLNKFKT